MVTQKKIEELEKKYFITVEKIFNNKKNIQFIKQSLARINKNLNLIKGKKKNQVEDSLEQMIRMILFNSASSMKWIPALFPVGSDVTFQTKDCFLFCDVKTITTKDKNGNSDKDAKDYRIQVQGNESTYPDNKSPVKGEKGNNKGKNLTWLGPSIPMILEKKPVITIFVTFHYEQNNQKYKIKESILYCIPNGKLQSHYGDLIESFKQFDTTKIDMGTNARFSSDKFKDPKLTTGWSRKKILRKLSNI